MTDPNDICISDYNHFIQLPLKFAGCWEWFPNSENEFKIILNNIYLALVLFVLLNLKITLIVNLYTEWVDIMSSLDKLADGLPLLIPFAVVIYFALYKEKLYDLVEFMNENFKFHSARGLTNMTMAGSYTSAKKFAYVYTAWTLFTVTVYVFVPIIFHLWTHQPLYSWAYMDADGAPYVTLAFLRLYLGQAFVGLVFGQLGVFFVGNCILLCGQLDLLCCSVRNARYTALLQSGVQHSALMRQHADIEDDERHSYVYSKAEMKDSVYHYDTKVNSRFVDRRSQFDIYDREFEAATIDALRECARVYQVVAAYKDKFEAFTSPLLALRVVQVTIYFSTLLYAASVKIELVTVEYLAATLLDIFVYCYFGNQIILQAVPVPLFRLHHQTLIIIRGGKSHINSGLPKRMARDGCAGAAASAGHVAGQQAAPRRARRPLPAHRLAHICYYNEDLVLLLHSTGQNTPRLVKSYNNAQPQGTK